MSTYNPDAPVDNNGGWLQHTYQPQQNDSFYWSGSLNGPFGPNMGYNDGSRRNMNPVNPFAPANPNPFAQFGQMQPTNPVNPTGIPTGIPESAVQPFSSYPPSTPAGNQPSMGLNSMIDSSRRNIPVMENNPWAPQPTQPQFVPQSTPPANWNPTPFDYWNFQNQGFRVDMNTAALYDNNNHFGFDKRQTWENCYTQYRPIHTPEANWNVPQPSFCGYPQQGNTFQCPVMSQLQTSQLSWKDEAIKNWDMVK